MAELTVEAALKELREMFPYVQIIVDIRDCGQETRSGRNGRLEYGAQIGMNGEQFAEATLPKLMTVVRAWKKGRTK